jgi:bifunctional DNase/RNase
MERIFAGWMAGTIVVTAMFTGCSKPTPMEIEVEVRTVGFDRTSQSPVVVLQDTARDRALPIWIGSSEAQAIAMQLDGVTPPRPLTHDLMKTMLDQSGVELHKVLISELKDRTYYARIYLGAENGDLEIDSRPSDAIALAVRFHKPIFVATALFNGDAVMDLRQSEAASGGEAATIAGVTVQGLTAELAEYFDLPTGAGVLVSDAAEVSGLRRGDIVVEVAGSAVTGVGDFARKLRAVTPGDSLTLAVRRGKQRLEIDLKIPQG